VEAGEPTPPVGFFVHIMKTGGTSLRWMLLDGVLEPEELFPHKSDGVELEVGDLVMHHINPFLIPDRIAAQARGAKVIAAHYPYLARRLFPQPLVAFCLLRDPVDRVVSHLRHIQRDDFPERSYEELYEDPELFDPFFYNLQARAFVFEDQTANSLMVRTFDWDESHLERAKENLEQVELIGLSSDYPAFIRNLESIFGWSFGKLLHSHRTPRRQPDVPRRLRARIRDDLSYDRRFYEHAVELYRERGPLRTPELVRS
jgi:hypothetical protein